MCLSSASVCRQVMYLFYHLVQRSALLHVDHMPSICLGFIVFTLFFFFLWNTKTLQFFSSTTHCSSQYSVTADLLYFPKVRLLYSSKISIHPLVHCASLKVSAHTLKNQVLVLDKLTSLYGSGTSVAKHCVSSSDTHKQTKAGHSTP